MVHGVTAPIGTFRPEDAAALTVTEDFPVRSERYSLQALSADRRRG